VLSDCDTEPVLEVERCLRLYRKLTAGVSIVSVAGDEGPRGMTASTVTSVSLRPPLLLVCLTSGSRTLPVITGRRAFGVQLLRADQRELARSFASPGGPQFRDVPHREVLGVPVLRDCLAWSVCLLTDCRPYGDHHVVVGQVVATHVAGGPPLVWHGQDFAELANPSEEFS
jgi:flavin reductase (DIM6/NTAB) family NADH-FMN oxidoreductase RutF